VNLIPARLTGVLFALASGRGAGQAFKTMAQDASRHRSPNAGWPEAALAGGLNLRLSGPRLYEGQLTDDPYVNAGGEDPTPADIPRALAIYRRALAFAGLALAGLALAVVAML